MCVCVYIYVGHFVADRPHFESMLVNGSFAYLLSAFRGLREGDLLFCFLLVTEVLTWMLFLATSAGLLSVFSDGWRKLSAITVSSLLFVVGTIVFVTMILSGRWTFSAFPLGCRRCLVLDLTLRKALFCWWVRWMVYNSWQMCWGALLILFLPTILDSLLKQNWKRNPFRSLLWKGSREDSLGGELISFLRGQGDSHQKRSFKHSLLLPISFSDTNISCHQVGSYSKEIPLALFRWWFNVSFSDMEYW